MTSILHPPELRDWIAPLARVVDEGIEGWVKQAPVDPTDLHIYTVTSGTVAGLLYEVRAWADEQGDHYQCECEAGQNGKLCKHVAWVARWLERVSPRDVEQLAFRIKHEAATERAAALEARKAARAAEKARLKPHTFAERMNASGLTKGVSVQTRTVLRLRAGEPDEIDLEKGAWGVVEGLHFGTETLRVTFPATKERPGVTASVDPRKLKIKPVERTLDTTVRAMTDILLAKSRAAHEAEAVAS